ncbi:DUF664 domain-containing protein [Rhodococcus opacus]|uniref:DUF664 domain-containing protein n=1 Tax=Rhodococcus opacus TaxID=37919 RepID=A0A2S8JEN3_RHOOP|nr:DUF664 domain-containing protein [Rhodococcus opacus]PQP25506.1 hypothetical protein C5613_08080 [Rhodococcus opacus]
MTHLVDPTQAAEITLKSLAQRTAILAEYAAACEKSSEIAADHILEDTAEHQLVGTVNLRFIYLGMIGEVARHACHADILVEQIRANAANTTLD